MSNRFLLGVLVAAVALAGSVAAADVDVKLAADGDRLWRVSHDPTTNDTTVAVRIDRRWRNVAVSKGRAASALVAAGRLHVFYTSGKYTEYARSGRRPGPLWPKEYRGRKVLAACAGPQEGLSPTIYLLLGPDAPSDAEPSTQPTDTQPVAAVVAAETDAAATATQPAPQTEPGSAPSVTPASGDTIVMVRRGRRWSPLTVVEAADLDSVGGYHLASMPEGGLYLLVCTPDGWPVKFLRYADGEWSPLGQLEWANSAHRVRWLLAAGQDLLVAGAGSEGAWLRRVDLPGGAITETVPITLEGKPLVSDGGTSAGLCPSGVVLAMAWEADDSWRLGSVDPKTGAVSGVEEFSLAPVKPDAVEPWMQGVYVLLGAVMIIVLSRHVRRGPMGPFSLPAELAPAMWFKRVVAFMIDNVPGNYIALAVLRLNDTQVKQMLQDLHDAGVIPVPLQHFLLLALGIYVAYAIVMEWRWGATVGKMIFGMRVVDRDGGRPGLDGILVRNLTKPIEFLLFSVAPWLGFAFLLWPIFSRYRQRAGDMLAGTAVVDKRTGVVGMPERPLGSEGRSSEEPEEPPTDSDDV